MDMALSHQCARVPTQGLERPAVAPARVAEEPNWDRSVNRTPGARNAESRLTCLRGSGGIRWLPRLESNQRPFGPSAGSASELA